MGILADSIGAGIGDAMTGLLLGILSVSALVTSATVISSRLKGTLNSSPLSRVFCVPPRWAMLRLLGAFCAWAIVFHLGPEFLWHANTGGVALYSLASKIVTIFLCAAFLLPLLTDYGLMEFVGTLLQPVFRRLFTLPGRAAVDAMASWLSASSVGVIITIDQYEKANYTRREALVIATNFSITSLPFCLFVIQFIGLREHFFAAYGTIILIGLSCAMLLPRVWPLARIDDDHHLGEEAGPKIEVPGSSSAKESSRIFDAAMGAARRRAAMAPGPAAYLRTALAHVLDIWMGLLPIVVLAGTLGMAIAEFTSIMQTLAAPLVPVLTLLGLPEAGAAAPTFLVGFLDMFLPAAIGQTIESSFTRFVIACVSLTQLIYLSEVGALLLRSSLGVGMGLLLQMFVLRTLIALPIALIAAHVFMA